MVKYELPRLAFGYGDLEPYVDEHTMRMHHQILHKYYVDGLNDILEQISAESHPQYVTSVLSNLDAISEDARNTVGFFGGGFENHRMFWDTLAPGGSDSPGGKLGDSLDVYFGGFDRFKREFSTQACAIMGSGWCWMVFDRTYNRPEILVTENNDSPWTVGKVPLLGLDVWEHAYYLQHADRRSDYILSWWNVVNWDYVSGRYSEHVW